MFISNGEEEILLPSENATEVLESSSLLNLNSDSLDGLPPTAESPDSPPLSAVYTDVGVVPEHKKNEVEKLISNLESIKSQKLYI